MSTSRWRARDRVCGKEIRIEIDDEDGTIQRLEACPRCGAKPLYVDFIEQLPDDIEATTAALALAEEHGIDLREIEPTGKNGKVIFIDVLKAVLAVEEAAQDDESDGAESNESGEAGGA